MYAQPIRKYDKLQLNTLSYGFREITLIMNTGIGLAQVNYDQSVRPESV